MIPFKYPKRFVIAVMATWIALALYHSIPKLLGGNVPVITLAQVVLWAFLAWKIYTRPRAWGLGVGIFLMLSAVGTTVVAVKFAERIALADPTYEPLWPLIIGWESLIFIAGVCSVFLWFGYSETPSPKSPKEQTEPRTD